MAIDLASKYSSVIDERFKLGALTGANLNTDYDWVGVKSIKVYNIGTAEVVDYVRSGTSRYGTPKELDATTEELIVNNDKAFTFTVDKGNDMETMGVLNASKALQRQIDEVLIPLLDKHRLATMAALAGKVATGAITSPYDALLAGMEEMDEKKVPTSGIIAYVTPAFFRAIKQDEAFIRSGDLSQNMLIKGQVGEVDGARLVKVPSSYLPANTSFILQASGVVISPVKLTEYKIHENPPGIRGALVEGSTIYDTFVLENKKAGLYVHKTA